MIDLMLSDIAEACKGQLCGRNISVGDICTDTRKITEGSAFLAIKGERFDGHDFVSKAVEDGAAAVIVSSLKDGLKVPQVLVQDTRKAYMDIAGEYRRRFNIPVIGITGSVGKTTTREMTAAALSSRLKVHKNEGNFNNDIGLPAALLTLRDGFDIGVYEMGMNHLGEISSLSKMVAPTAGMISNVGISHIENLGSRENILKAKLEILDGMQNGAPLIVNIDNDMLKTVKYENLITCGFDENADYRALSCNTTEDGMTVKIKTPNDEFDFFLPVIGSHFVSNALEAIAVAEAVEISARDAAKGLENYKTVGMRQNIRRMGKVTIIEDCYNASPDSMRAGLDALRLIATKDRKIAVLGDMLELGDMSDKAHAEVGATAAEMGVDILFCFGERSSLMAKAAKETGKIKSVYHFDKKPQLSKKLCDIISDGDTVLFKASRGMRLEEIIQELPFGE